jgi:uncharacterized protein
MVSAFYASILAALICWLALNVVKSRRKNRIKYGDGGVDDLLISRSAHSNATETIPIALILLFFLEYNGGYLWLVHLFGTSLIIGRILHCRGILSDTLKGRILGMKMTVFTIVGLIISNLFFIPYHEFIKF